MKIQWWRTAANGRVLAAMVWLLAPLAMWPRDYFPPPESQGGWRALEKSEDLRQVAGMNPAKLDELREWLLQSDQRNFAAVVIRHGYLVLEVERGNSAKTDARRVASVSKAVCATVLAIASEQSRQGRASRKMSFDDLAFEFIPWAQPLSDPRKARITVKQLLNHTSGICPEATGAPNDGSWEYLLGHSGDARTAKLAFDPGAGCGYSTHALAHAALVCETVTGKPYDQFAIEALFKPLGVERWWFQYYEGGEKIGRHPSHGLGLPARELARIAYCLLHEGRWGDRQVIPKWFVEETATATHGVTTPEMRWKLNPQVFSHGWELPARHKGESGRSGAGIPADARSKPGSGGQLIAFVPSLDLVIARQTGSSGEWAYEEYLRRACAAVLPDKPAPVRIFFDTDMHTDCDDAGALAVLHGLADQGECEILATVVSVRDPLSAATVDAINAYYGRPRLPLGMVKGPGVWRQSSFTARIAAGFPHRVKSPDDVPDATEVYRGVLEQQPDRSVVLVTVGYLTNLRNLLQLPAMSGRPSGRELIERKVVRWVCMGGNFVGHPPKDDLKLGNVNFQQDATATLETIPRWPGPIVFVGREIGSVPSGLQVGANLVRTPLTNPVRMAYFHYFGGQQKSRHAADLTTVLYAVRGLRDYWDISAPGRMQLQPETQFEWQFAADGNQFFLLKKPRDGQPNDRYLESVLDELLLKPPLLTTELILCGAEEVFILSFGSNAEPRKVWSWQATDSPEIPASLHRAFRSTDDCKPVAGGRQILLSSSAGAVALVDRESRGAVFYAAVANAHSIELLPGGRMAAAASVAQDGNRILLFDLATRKEVAGERLISAHGVVWDERRGWLWALGYEELRAYRVIEGPEGGCELRLEFQTELPESNGHELVAVPGSARLFISTGKHGWYFDRATRAFTPHETLADQPNLKSYSVHPQTGRIAYVQAEGTNWWAERVHFLNPPGVLHLPGQRLYKARWR